ncbi:MAG: rod shape-determining protein MreC [Pelagibacteraceae bacterium]
MKFASSENVDVKKNIIIFIVISLILFFIDRSDNKYFKTTRSAINDGIIYTTVVLKSPFNFISDTVSSFNNFFVDEKIIAKNKLLDLENEVTKLKNEKITLLLQLENLKKVTGEENYKFETIKTKVLSYKSNILSESIIINKGSRHGISSGDPIIKNNMLVGKITDVNFNSSYGVLITNINSRVPVRIGQKNYNAIAVGNPSNANTINLDFLPKEYSLNEDDYVYTTSIDNIMPDGILVGQIKKDKQDKFYLKPMYDFNQMDYLTIVKMGK